MADLDPVPPTPTVRDIARMKKSLQCPSQHSQSGRPSALKVALHLPRVSIPAWIPATSIPKSSLHNGRILADPQPSKVLPLFIVNRHPTAARTLSLKMLAHSEQISALPTESIPALMSSAILPMIQHSIVAVRIDHMVKGVSALPPAKEVWPVALLATRRWHLQQMAERQLRLHHQAGQRNLHRPHLQ